LLGVGHSEVALVWSGSTIPVIATSGGGQIGSANRSLKWIRATDLDYVVWPLFAIVFRRRVAAS